FQLSGSFILFGIAVVVLIVLSFSQRRAKKGLSTCNGVPGIVPPINFLNPRHRLVYVLACGLVASSLLNIILQSSSSVEVENKWFKDIVQNIYIVFFILVLVIQTYPLLACVQSPIPLLGYSLGALYTIV
uniref:Uncharacterized protein n=1 Tax=Amphimedon queenslandica TaxID=400682 RepID=A0A1X7UT70_AMPQE